AGGPCSGARAAARRPVSGGRGSPAHLPPSVLPVEPDGVHGRLTGDVGVGDQDVGPVTARVDLLPDGLEVELEHGPRHIAEGLQPLLRRDRTPLPPQVAAQVGLEPCEVPASAAAMKSSTTSIGESGPRLTTT